MNHIKKEDKTSYLVLVIILIISFLIYFFLGVKFEISLIEKLIISIFSLSLMIYFARRATSEFALFSLISITSFIGLTTSLGSSIAGNGLINTSFRLGVWPIFILAMGFSLLMMWLYQKMKSPDKYAIMLFITFLVYWFLIATNAKYLDGWISENALVIPFVIIIYFVHKWFKFSKLSYSLIFVFMILHVMGSHYTYSEVPLGYWMSEFFNLDRNHFDRVVHFSFGLLWAYPMREIFKRIGEAKGFWSFWIPIELVLALSCVFELIEWAFAVIFGGDLGVAYLGTQGDVWDAQKDMALAGLGSIITMLVTATTLIYYSPKSFFKEFKDSFKVKHPKVLGEEAIIRFNRKN